MRTTQPLAELPAAGEAADMHYAGIVLCGGQSRRMGTDKAWLPFGSETMLQRVVRVLSDAMGPVVVVCAAIARLPPLPSDVRVVFDRRADRGPLEGLAVGLKAVAELAPSAVSSASVAYATSCDAPLLTPAFVRRMIELLGSADAAVPMVDGRLHPLAAVYRAAVLPEIERRLAADQLRLTALVESLNARYILPEEVRDVDPHLLSLQNVNDQATYRAALESLRSPSTNH